MGQANSADLPDGLSEISFAERLDSPNQFEMPAKISLCAHWIFDPIFGNHPPDIASLEILRPQIRSASEVRTKRRGYVGRRALMK
jgi:hypothetical protein